MFNSTRTVAIPTTTVRLDLKPRPTKKPRERAETLDSCLARCDKACRMIAMALRPTVRAELWYDCNMNYR